MCIHKIFSVYFVVVVVVAFFFNVLFVMLLLLSACTFVWDTCDRACVRARARALSSHSGTVICISIKLHIWFSVCVTLFHLGKNCVRSSLRWFSCLLLLFNVCARYFCRLLVSLWSTLLEQCWCSYFVVVAAVCGLRRGFICVRVCVWLSRAWVCVHYMHIFHSVFYHTPKPTGIRSLVIHFAMNDSCSALWLFSSIYLSVTVAVCLFYSAVCYCCYFTYMSSFVVNYCVSSWLLISLACRGKRLVLCIKTHLVIYAHCVMPFSNAIFIVWPIFDHNRKSDIKWNKLI